MATRPEAVSVFQPLQNPSDDWDYETGAEAGYDLKDFGEWSVFGNANVVRSLLLITNPSKV